MSEEKFNEVMPGQVNGKNNATLKSDNVKVNLRNGLGPLPKETFLNHEDEWQNACRKGNFDTLKNMKNLNITDYEGRTPLHYASRYGHDAIIEFLLEKGLDVSQSDYDGATPLHQAAFGGHVNTVQLLLSKGANTQAKDRKGKTPLDTVNRMLAGKKIGGMVRNVNESKRGKYEEIQRMLSTKGGRRTRKRSKRSKRQSRKN
jgi:ankyrin repeat protein